MSIERTYKGYKIVAKTDPDTYFYDERISCVPHELPQVAEVYYPDGTFMLWTSSPHGKYASMRNAARCIHDYLDSSWYWHDKPDQPEYEY